MKRGRGSRGYWPAAVLAAWLTAALVTFDNAHAEEEKPSSDTLVLGAYTVPKDVYEKELIPGFQKYWKEKTGSGVKFIRSYLGSVAQARAIIDGSGADVAALSHEGDMEDIAKAGLISSEWRDRRWKGFVTNSLAVIAYRPGNPKRILDWEDLARPDVDVLYPNPKTSGGAMWFISAIYGAGLRMSQARTGTPDPAYARDLLKRVQQRVKVMNDSGRESVSTFEQGIGDALVTYEDEALRFEFLVPKATILIQNPVAVVDRNAEKHGVRDVADAFVRFLHSESAQRAFGRHGFRPVDPEIAREFGENFPTPTFPFGIEYLGGWAEVKKTIYGPEGIWTQIMQELAGIK